MKKHSFQAILSLIVLSLVAAPGSRAQSTLNLPDLVTVVPMKVFAPPGFNTNNNVQVVLSGILPNTCFKLTFPKGRVDLAAKRIYVRAQANAFSGDWCAQIESNYSVVVDLGIIPMPGDYQVVLELPQGKERITGHLPIAQAEKPSGDDLLYADVQDAFVDTAPFSTGTTLILSGNMGNDCVTLKDVQVLQRAENIIEVLPLADFKPNALCKQIQVPFQKKIPIISQWTGKTLIYIRSLNGQSLSKIVDL